jgi:hypothetical protein
VADVSDPRMRQGRVAALASRGTVLGTRPGDVVVWCEDNGSCPECISRWPLKGWRPITDIRCDHCVDRNDLKHINGEWRCDLHRVHPSARVLE